MRLALNLKNGREGMTLAATDLRLRDGLMRFFAICADLHLLAKEFKQRPDNARFKLNELTGVGAFDGWHGTGAAKRRFPFETGGLQKAAFLAVTSTQVVAVEIFAFRAVGGFHGKTKFKILNSEF